MPNRTKKSFKKKTTYMSTCPNPPGSHPTLPKICSAHYRNFRKQKRQLGELPGHPHLISGARQSTSEPQGTGIQPQSSWVAAGSMRGRGRRAWVQATTVCARAGASHARAPWANGARLASGHAWQKSKSANDHFQG